MKRKFYITFGEETPLIATEVKGENPTGVFVHRLCWILLIENPDGSANGSTYRYFARKNVGKTGSHHPLELELSFRPQLVRFLLKSCENIIPLEKIRRFAFCAITDAGTIHVDISPGEKDAREILGIVSSDIEMQPIFEKVFSQINRIICGANPA